MTDAYTLQLDAVRALANDERYVMSPREKVALRAVLVRLDRLERHVTTADVPDEVVELVDRAEGCAWGDINPKCIIAAAVNAMREKGTSNAV